MQRSLEALQRLDRLANRVVGLLGTLGGPSTLGGTLGGLGTLGLLGTLTLGTLCLLGTLGGTLGLLGTLDRLEGSRGRCRVAGSPFRAGPVEDGHLESEGVEPA